VLSVEPKARFITLTDETLKIRDITKTEFNNCFIIQCIISAFSTKTFMKTPFVHLVFVVFIRVIKMPLAPLAIKLHVAGSKYT
jgi:hypothetical protein